ncbi:hypothetical protein IT575_12040 [bacterium]|nr:hypothetical protein [bacterium]
MIQVTVEKEQSHPVIRKAGGVLKIRMLARLAQCFLQASKGILGPDQLIVVHIKHRFSPDGLANSISRERQALGLAKVVFGVEELRYLGLAESARPTAPTTDEFYSSSPEERGRRITESEVAGREG